MCPRPLHAGEICVYLLYVSVCMWASLYFLATEKCDLHTRDWVLVDGCSEEISLALIICYVDSRCIRLP